LREGGYHHDDGCQQAHGDYDQGGHQDDGCHNDGNPHYGDECSEGEGH
jgi:hypothetical protein